MPDPLNPRFEVATLIGVGITSALFWALGLVAAELVARVPSHAMSYGAWTVQMLLGAFSGTCVATLLAPGRHWASGAAVLLLMTLVSLGFQPPDQSRAVTAIALLLYLSGGVSGVLVARRLIPPGPPPERLRPGTSPEAQ